MRRSITFPVWLAAATLAPGCASSGTRLAAEQKPDTAPLPESKAEASLTVRVESVLTTDRFVLDKAEVFLDHQPLPLYGEPPRTTLDAGAHELQVVLVCKSARSLPPGYRYRLRSRHAFTIADGETREIVVRVLDDGNARPTDAFSVTFDGVPGT